MQASDGSGLEQVKALMVAAQVLPLDRLEQLLPTPAGAAATAAMGEARRQEILAQLPRHAVLVQGVWVVKSEHMYKDDCKHQAQVAALRVCVSRCMSVYVCMCVCMYVCIYVCMHVCMCVCRYVGM